MPMKIVPMEATPEMRRAGRGPWATSDREDEARTVYRAMLSAAPQPSPEMVDKLCDLMWPGHCNADAVTKDADRAVMVGFLKSLEEIDL